PLLRRRHQVHPPGARRPVDGRQRVHQAVREDRARLDRPDADRGEAVRGVLLALLAACGSTPAPRVELPATKPAIVIVPERYDPTANLQTTSVETTFSVEGHDVPATITQPTKAAKRPGLVLMAG